VEPKCGGGLLLLRHVTLLSRRNVVYFHSGAHKAKRRRNRDHTEGVAVVRELIGTLVSHGIQNGHLVTSANRFSPKAQDLTENPNVLRYGIRLELKAFPELLEMLQVASQGDMQGWQLCERGLLEPSGIRISNPGRQYSYETAEETGFGPHL
jgi:hypothetical protein